MRLTRNINVWLHVADLAVAAVWVVIVVKCFPVSLQKTQGIITLAAWYLGIITVGGQNPLYLHPRYRILVSMVLSVGFAIAVDIFWAGGGHGWYMKGGLHSALALFVMGTLTRLAIAQLLTRPALHLIPSRLPAVYAPLLAELAAQPNIFVDAPSDTPDAPLPAPRPDFPLQLMVTDLHLREAEFSALLPRSAQVEIVDLCEFYERYQGKAAMIRVDDGWVLPLPLRVPSPMREVVVRLFDALVVLATAPLTLVVIGVAAVLIKLTSRGPVLFRQVRIGRYGRPFTLFKLRTMRVDAEADGPRWAGDRDPRTTGVGRLLRATGIDELPQFWNVLWGEMSLVGPRPELPAIVERLEGEIPFYSARHLAPPGIAGWAQLHQGGDATLDDVATKLRYDLYYIKNASLGFNLRILLGTLQMLLHLAKPAPKAKVPVDA
jgi:lipopolysaccharide/colanic/teichoic acid biosynthesis glycosyltransferase